MRADRNRILDRVTIIAFVLLLCVPLVGQLLRVGTAIRSVRFETEEMPSWRWNARAIATFPSKVQAYYNTHFAFRDLLMSVHARLKVQGFGISSSDRVTLGSDGWLFYAGESIVADYRRTRPFTEDELARWTAVLVQRRDWLRARGIPFLFFVAPNPQTIYPEHMPETMRPIDRPSRFDQLVTYLRAHSDVDVLDLRPALRAHKEHERVYYKTDTHWNQVGGFVAYQQIQQWLKPLFPQLRELGMQDFTRVEVPHWPGGLSYFLGEPSLFDETRVELHPRIPPRMTSSGEPMRTDELFDAWTVRSYVVRESEDGELPRAVFLRDSQFSAPAQFLSRHFRRSVFLWSKTLPRMLVMGERPSVVIQELAERRLMEEVPTDLVLP